MKKVEEFLNSNYYPLIVSTIGFIAWLLPADFLWLNNTLILLIIGIAVVLLSFYENTKHIVPLTLTLLFMINVQKIGIEDIGGISVYHIMLGMVIVGLIIHFIRFRHKLKFDYIAFALLLVGISYLLPMTYMPFSTLLLSVSITGLLYVIFYVFFRSTATVSTDEVLNYFFFASLQLLAILIYSIGSNFFTLLADNSLTETFTKGLKNSWGRSDFGFGNINDLIIHFSILSSGIFYKIIKHPKNYTYWIIVVLGIVTVILSGSRGGLVTLALILFVYLVMLVVYGQKQQIAFVSLLVLTFGIVMIFNSDIVKIFYENFIQGGLDDLESFSSGRIKLYREAMELFREYPIFGAGWTTLEANNVNRIQIYHSTVFHTLAITGIVGAIAVFILIISWFATLLNKISINVLILGVPWTMTMIYGLFDNTVHMVIFTILTIILFTAVQSEEKGFINSEREFFQYLTLDQV